jgi:hypothetical protein
MDSILLSDHFCTICEICQKNKRTNQPPQRAKQKICAIRYKTPSLFEALSAAEPKKNPALTERDTGISSMANVLVKV